MSYTRHNWQTGDVVSAARLNNIEDGVQSAGGLVKHTVTNDTLDCSYNDLLAEVNAGKLPYAYITSDNAFDLLVSLYVDGNCIATFAAGMIFYNSDPDEPLILD